MQPIIRRTITITVTETWTITWPDGQETVWTETKAWPASALDESLLPLVDKVERDDGTLALDDDEPTAADE